MVDHILVVNSFQKVGGIGIQSLQPFPTYWTLMIQVWNEIGVYILYDIIFTCVRKAMATDRQYISNDTYTANLSTLPGKTYSWSPRYISPRSIWRIIRLSIFRIACSSHCKTTVFCQMFDLFDLKLLVLWFTRFTSPNGINVNHIQRQTNEC